MASVRHETHTRVSANRSNYKYEGMYVYRELTRLFSLKLGRNFSLSRPLRHAVPTAFVTHHLHDFAIPGRAFALRSAGVLFRDATVFNERGGDERYADKGGIHDENGVHTAHVGVEDKLVLRWG